MKKLLLFASIAISLPVITALDTEKSVKKVKTEIAKPHFTKVEDWSNITHPRKRAYYEHLYRQQ